MNDLSRMTGISPSNLSSLELGKSSPTLSTLNKLAAAFDMKPGAFLDAVMSGKAFLCPKEGARSKASASDEFYVETLTAAAAGARIEAALLTLKPGSGPAVPAIEAAERFLYCLEGAVTATVEDERYCLETGDGLYLLSEAVAQLTNRSEEPAVILMTTLKR